MMYLFVSTFGQKTDWIKQGIPIEVGAANRQNIRYDLRDDTGNNISVENPYWGELTGLYWIWKNYEFQADDIVGFCHYNKCLKIEPDEVLNILGEGEKDWIILPPARIVPHDFPEDIIVIESVLKEKYKKYYDAWKCLYDSEGSSKDGAMNCSTCEMFFTKRDEFYAYCEFLFGVLTDVKRIVGEVDREPYHKRYLAFLGERLLSVYLLAESKKVQYIPINPYRKPVDRILVKLINIFHVNQNSGFYRKLKVLYLKGNGGRSSYLK